MFDNHVHSKFSTDGKMTIREACEAALKAGLEGLTFTDHLDIDYPGYEDEFRIDFNPYQSLLGQLKQEYHGKLKILKGIEIGIQPHVIRQTLNEIKGQDFDYRLGSVHILDGEDPYAVGYYDNKSKMQAYIRYFELMTQMVQQFDDFDMLGHFDYIVRKAPYADRSIWYRELGDQVDTLFTALVSKGKGFELNSSTYREQPDRKTAVFDRGFLTRYRELGGTLMTLGSDAHTPEYIGYKFDYFREVAKQAGFRYTVHFEAGKPVYDAI